MAQKKDFYDEFWTETEAAGWTPRDREIAPFERGLFHSRIRPQGYVLDFGCGDGSHSAPYLTSAGFRYVGIDVSDRALKSCSEAGYDVLKFNSDFSIPSRRDVFDAVICFEVLEHVFEPRDAGEEILRVLKPGGVLIGSVPNIAFLGNRALLAFGMFCPGGSPLTSLKRPWADPHIRFFTPTTIEAFLREVGFADIEVIGTDFSLLLLPRLYKSTGILRGVLKAISYPIAALGRAYPSLFTSRVYFVARKQGNLPGGADRETGSS